MGSQQSVASKKTYIISEDEAKRLGDRHTHMDVLKNIHSAKNHFGDKKKKLQHAMYLLQVGKIPDFQNFHSSRKYDSELVENYLKDAILYENCLQLMEKREEFAVIEDDFGPTLERMMKEGKKPSFQNLKEACSNYDDENHIRIHSAKSDVTRRYFIERGVADDDARAYAFAIAFYTGAYSWAMSMEANLVIRRLCKPDQLYADDAQIDINAAMIMHYLIRGLSHVDFYWGPVIRYVNLTEKDLQAYVPGEIVTWLQFSSADKGGKDMAHFTERNTILSIYSLTGRSIRYFSNCAEQEDEVLFLPHSSFLVCHVEKQRQTHIHLRQVELGLCKYVVLWVDDNIFDENWENKRHMEKASTLGTHINVHFIPKSNTDSALAFLQSEFGRRLKDSDTFRIVTDMKRTNESSPSTAGARLIYEARKLGYQQKCLVYTGHEQSAYEKLKMVFGSITVAWVEVTQHQDQLGRFVIFE